MPKEIMPGPPLQSPDELREKLIQDGVNPNHMDEFLEISQGLNLEPRSEDILGAYDILGKDIGLLRRTANETIHRDNFIEVMEQIEQLIKNKKAKTPQEAIDRVIGE
jgi:hypothetical protein